MNVLTKQHRTAETATRWPNGPLTSLNHYLDMDWMREDHRRVHKDGAPGHEGLLPSESASAVAGTLTVTRADGARFQGSYDLTTSDGRTLVGQFDVPAFDPSAWGP